MVESSPWFEARWTKREQALLVKPVLCELVSRWALDNRQFAPLEQLVESLQPL
jgi:hypothetical protein